MPKRKQCGKGRYLGISFTANVFCLSLLVSSASAETIESERELQSTIQQAMQAGPSAAFAQNTSQSPDSGQTQSSPPAIRRGEGQEAHLVKDELRGWDNMIRQERFQERLLEEDRLQDDSFTQPFELQSKNRFSKSLDDHDSFEDQIQQSVVFDPEEKEDLIY